MSDAEMDVDEGDMAYDPDQDPDEKRHLRKEYRGLQHEAEAKQSNPNDYTAEQLMRDIQKADTLFAQVKNPQEATLDSDFLLKASHLGAQKARAMKSGGSGFDLDDFISKLFTFMGGNKRMDPELLEGSDEEVTDDDIGLDWDKVGRKALVYSRRVPVTDFMLGPLNIEQKKRVVGKRAKFEKNKEEERRPQEIKEEDIQRSENETTKNVLIIKNLLSHAGATNIFRFVVNPKDFAQSVENIFYLSFLIRDGECALETNEEGEPVVYICEAPTDDDRENGLKRRQIVFEFDMATWKRAIDIFNITECMIPQRPPAQTQIKGKWYG